MERYVRFGLRNILLAALLTGTVLLAAESTEESRPPREEEKKTVAPAEQKPAPEPGTVRKEEPTREEPGVAPPDVKKEGPVEEEPIPVPVERKAEEKPLGPSPNPTPSRPTFRMAPEPQPQAPEPEYRNNERGTYGERGNYEGQPGNEGGNFRYGERGNYDRTFHGDHDRWRHDRFRGSWDFLIFPGPVIYAPQPYYGPSISRQIAGVHVEYAGDDATGASLAGAVSGLLRESEMGPVASASDASLELYIISMDEEPTNPGYGSAVSVSYILMPEYRFITAQLLDVGSEQIDALAESVVSYSRQLLDEYR